MGRRLRFEDFEFDVDSGELAGPEGKTRLTEKPAQLLIALAERPRQVVTREELHARLWSGDTFVDFANNLHAAAKKLRDTLGDKAGSPRFIETIPRKGYRFLPMATWQGSEEKPDPVFQTGPRRLGQTIFLGSVLVAMAASLFWLAKSRERKADLPAGKIMLAVMPFRNLSDSVERDYICEGMTEELIVHMSRLDPERLGVVARISAMTFKETEWDAGEAGDELGADFVLTGSIRGTEERLRVSARLIQVKDRTHLWSEHYGFSFEDILDVQNQVAKKVARTLAVRLLEGGTAVMARAQLEDTEAYRAYLRGRFEWFKFNEKAYRRAAGFFERAIALAPEAAVAYAGLADTYNLLSFTAQDVREPSFEKAKQAAGHALQLDPECAEAHNALAFALLYHDRDYPRADAHFQRALDLNPGFAMAHHWYAGLLSAAGRHEEAISAMRRSLELDPLSLSAKSDLGWYYLFADRYEEAVNVCRETLERDPNYGWAISGLAMAYAKLELWRQAAFYAKKDLENAGYGREISARMDRLRQGTGIEEFWRIQLEKHLHSEKDGQRPYPFGMATTLANLNRIPEALDWLERAIDDSWLIFIRVDPRLDPLHGHPRFEALATRIGL